MLESGGEAVCPEPTLTSDRQFEVHKRRIDMLPLSYLCLVDR
jgi:hypothetical protein